MRRNNASKITMTSYKLVYFNSKGRAEVCRFIFAQAGVEYEDKRVDREEWEKLKPSTLTGALPLLEVDGKQLPGSGPMARFLAERFDLAGSNDFENAEIASIIDVMNDCMQKFAGLFYEKDEERLANIKKDLENEVIPKYFRILEKKIQDNDANGLIYGRKVTYADFHIYCMLDFVLATFPEVLGSYPSMMKLRVAVKGHPNIAKWLKERPSTDM